MPLFLPLAPWCLLAVVAVGWSDEAVYTEKGALPGHACRPVDCVDLQCFNVVFENSGPHRVYQDNVSVAVSCDVSVGGGWTVMQRRLDGSVNFTQPWTAYRNGFGNHGSTTELWFGNEYVHRMSLRQLLRMRIEMKAFNGETAFMMYDNFSLADENRKYRLMYDNSTTSDNVKEDDMSTTLLQDFSTYDDDNSASGMCSLKKYHKGWWYDNCFRIHLNGEYPRGFDKPPKRWRYIIAFSFRRQESLRSCKMMTRPMAIGDDIGAYCARHRKNPCHNGGTCVYVPETNTSQCRCSRHTCGSRCDKCPQAWSLSPITTPGNYVPLVVGSTALCLLVVVGAAASYASRLNVYAAVLPRRMKNHFSDTSTGRDNSSPSGLEIYVYPDTSHVQNYLQGEDEEEKLE